MFKAEDLFYMMNQPEVVAEALNKLARVELVAGVAGASTITLAEVPQAVIAVFAVVSATGAFATKALLDVTTDYTVSGKVLTCVTDQSANKLLVIYK